ncbi:MAG: hypothetical protein M3Q65_01580, partial [Chloroflexota bacterium]|nr:hypothetical protein [Chloroflexota bacterium]
MTPRAAVNRQLRPREDAVVALPTMLARMYQPAKTSFAVWLLNAQRVRAVPGRKTDVRLRHEVVSVA